MRLVSSSLSGSLLDLARFGAAAALAVTATLLAPAEASAGQFGQGRVLSMVPASPGFPEGIAVDGNRIFVSGPATFGTAGKGPSTIEIYHRTKGTSLGTISIQGEFLAAEHALSCVTTDGAGRVYALSTQLGVVRQTEGANGQWSQDIYASPIPDLPTCWAVAPGEACAPTIADLPPIPNDIAFDEEGFAYVTDSFQATIFRIPQGGGEPEIWFQSPAIASLPGAIGVNGIRVSPDGSDVYFSVSSTMASGGAEGVIFKLPRVDTPLEADLEVFHVYANGEAPDGIAFGQNGDLYVALAGSNQISVLTPAGWEVGSISGPNGCAVPFDAPANVAFDGAGRLLVTNHAIFTADPAHFAVLQVRVDDGGQNLFKP